MKEKNQNIEMIRAISCVMVIVIHVTNYFNRAYGEIPQGEYFFSVICNALARVSVPCFFMISGALLLHRKDTIRQCLKRAFRVLVVLLVWSIVYYFFNVYYMHSSVELREIFHVPTEAHLWYLYALIPIYLVLPLLQWICGKMKPWMENALLYCWAGVTIISTVGTAIAKLYGLDTGLILGANSLFYLFAGHVLMKNKGHTKGKAKVWLLLSLLSCVLNALLTYVFSVVINQHETIFFQYRSALIMIAAISFFVGVIKSERVWQERYVSNFCECSFGIYVMHILFLDIFKKHIHAQEVTVYWAVPLLTFGIVIATWSSVWLLRRWKMGRKIS